MSETRLQARRGRGLPAIYMWWSGTAGTTILPGSGRPRDCPQGCVRRHAARFTKTNDDQYLKSYNERNDNGFGFSNGF